MDLRHRLLILKSENKLTTEMLSARSGVPKGTINKLLNGETGNPRGETLSRLAGALNCPLEMLVSGTGFETRNQTSPGRIPGVHRASERAKPAPAEILPVHLTRIPLIGTIAAGNPIECIQNAKKTVPALGDERVDCALRVHCDSMIGARIYDGDIVYIRLQDDVPDGSIAAVIIENEATLKRVYHIPNGVRLVSENPKYPPMVFTMPARDSIRILGLAVAFRGAIR